MAYERVQPRMHYERVPPPVGYDRGEAGYLEPPLERGDRADRLYYPGDFVYVPVSSVQRGRGYSQ